MPVRASDIPFTAKLTLEEWGAVFLVFVILTYLFQGFHVLEALYAGLISSSIYIAGKAMLVFALKRREKTKQGIKEEEFPGNP